MEALSEKDLLYYTNYTVLNYKVQLPLRIVLVLIFVMLNARWFRIYSKQNRYLILLSVIFCLLIGLFVEGF